MAKLTLEEKRLKALKLQLFGKQKTQEKPVPQKSQKTVSFSSSQPQVNTSFPSTATLNFPSIRTDLLKVLALSSLVLIFQLTLYFLIQRNLINLNFLF